LAAAPLVDEDESGEYVLLRVSRPIGVEPPGGARAVPGTKPRGWVVLPAEHVMQDGTAVVLLQTTASGLLKATRGSDARRRGASVEYRVTTQPGASGAPLFDPLFQVIALHQGRRASWLWNLKRGTAIAHVVERLRAKQIFETLPRQAPSNDDYLA
jgi:hypothetical protein